MGLLIGFERGFEGFYLIGARKRGGSVEEGGGGFEKVVVYVYVLGPGKGRRKGGMDLH